MFSNRPILGAALCLVLILIHDPVEAQHKQAATTETETGPQKTFTGNAEAAPTSKTQAQDWFRKAEEAYKEQRYQAALRFLQRAHALFDDPQLLFNIAQVQRKLGQCAAARDNYQRYLAVESHSQRRAQAAVGLDRLRDCHELEPPAPTGPGYTGELPLTDQTNLSTVEPPTHSHLWIVWTVTTTLTVGTIAAAAATMHVQAENRRLVRERISPSEAASRGALSQRWALATDLLGLASLAMGGLSIYWTLAESRSAPPQGPQTRLVLEPLAVRLSTAW